MNYYESNRPGQKRIRSNVNDSCNALVSVVTPFYNAGTFFEETYNSVINQTFPWYEWIIVDDGSTDKDSLDVLEKFEKTDSRIKVIHQENGGLACARNTGFNAASTELIVPLDADDLIAPTFLDCLYWALMYNPNAAWAYCDTVGFSGMEYIWKKHFDAATMKTENLLVATAMIRKSAFDLIGGYKVEKCSYNEDWRFWLEMLSEHQYPVHVNANLFWYRRQDTSMLSDVKSDKQKAELNNRIIENARKHVDTDVQAVEYPIDIKLSGDIYEYPVECEWNSSVSEYSNCSTEKKVLWIIPWLSLGGADKFNLDAISGLREKGYKSIIVCTKPSPNEWMSRFELLTDEIYSLPDFMSIEHYSEFITYLIQSRNVDEIIVSNSSEGYALLPFLRQLYPEIPIIDYVHMEEWYWHGGGYARTSGSHAGLVDKTLVCNSSTRDVMVKLLGADDARTECLHIGVDDVYFDPSKEDDGYLHQMLGLSKETKIVLYPCRICAQKRPFMMLDIAEYVKKKYSDVAFVVVGEGPDLAGIKKSINKRNLNNTVYCIGSSDKMRKCYKDSDVLLICSMQEGLTLTTYEACSMGLPIVSSNVGGQRDLVSSENGYLIEVPMEEQKGNQKWSDEEVKQFGDAIVNILSDSNKAKELGANGRKEVIEKFSITKMVDTLATKLNEVAEDENRKEIRFIQSKALKSMPNIAGEFFTVNLRWEIGEHRCGGPRFIHKVIYHLRRVPVLGDGLTAIWHALKKIIRK